LDTTKDAEIVVADPRAEQTVHNFLGYEELKSRFHLLPMEFGKRGYEAEFFEAIADILKDRDYF